jgi:flagellar biosynthesis/type III secretory pathway M-ring protein FliF/YscJ
MFFIQQIFQSKNLSHFISLFFFLLFAFAILKYLNSVVEGFSSEKAKKEEEKAKKEAKKEEEEEAKKEEEVVKESFVKPISHSFTKSTLTPVKL